VIALGASCSTPAPVLHSVDPDVAAPAADTPAVVHGENLVPSVLIALDDDKPPTVEDEWLISVRLDDAVTDISSVTWRDSTAIDVVIPAGLALGGYDLLATAPDGAQLVLESAITVGVRGCVLADWSHAATITIDSGVGGLTSYPVRVELDTAQMIGAGIMRADCGDIRFGDEDGAALDHYVQGGCDTATTVVWVEVPAIEAGEQPIYLQTGNPDAMSASSGADTFSFFDDFDDGDADEWTLGVDRFQPSVDVGHAEGVDNGEFASPDFSLRLFGHASCTAMPFDGVMPSGKTDVGLPAGDYCIDYDARTDIDSFQFDTQARARRFAYADDVEVTARQVDCMGNNCTTSSGWEADTGRVPLGSAIASLELRGFADDCAEAVTWFDNVRIRQCADPEPTTTVGAAQTCAP
jgi:hypothetical protein